MSQHCPGLPLALWCREASPVLLARRMVAQEQHRRVGAGPCEGGLPNLLARGAIALASSRVGALDPPAIGHARLHAREALAIMDRGPQDQGQALPEARNRAQAIEGLRIVRLGRLDASHLQGGEPAVVVVAQRAIHRAALLDGRIRKACSDAGPVRLVGQCRADLGPVVLAVGSLDRGQPLGPLAQERRPAPQQVSGGPPRRGIDRRLGEQPAAEHYGTLLGSDRIIRGLTPMEGFQVEGVSQDAGSPLLGAQVGQPGPR
jgi:hypothetical protein